MARYELEVSGLDAFLDGEVVSGVLEQLGRDILTDAQRLVPVETGALRDSGFVDVEPGRVRIGFEEDYATYVELGTGRGPAQPYLAPAALNRRGRLR